MISTVKNLFLHCLLVFTVCGVSSAEDASGTIETVISGFNSPRGQAAIALFSSHKGFPENPKAAYRIAFADIEGDSCRTVFSDIPYGTYAVSAFHDTDSNKKLKKTIIGIPLEGTAASNDAKGRMGPPKFKDASFVLDSALKTVEMKMSYPK